MGYTPPAMYITVVGGITRFMPPGNSGIVSRLLPNSGGDLYPSIQMNPTTSLQLFVNAGTPVNIYDQTAGSLCNFKYANPDFIIESAIADKNLSLVTTGTGKVKFGTYTAGVKADSIGYIEVLDSGGTSRRLMVQSA